MSASGDDPKTIIAFADARFGTIGQTVAGGLMGAFLAFFLSTIELVQAILNVMVLPLQQVGIQAANVMRSFIGGAAGIIEQGAVTTQQTLAPGASWAVGPLTFAFGIAAAVAGLWVMGWILSQQATSDIIPFTFTNVPLVGSEEDKDEGN